MRRRAEDPTYRTSRLSREGRSSEEIELLLIEILSQLATVLVSVGYGISGVNRLTRRAYFRAARRYNSESQEKPSIAQIAAQTGLTRLEVSQLARADLSRDRKLVAPLSRAHRVSLGWQSDRRFCKSSGAPLALPFSGKLRSFSVLVKEYSGDIPARAMLLEMKRLKMVRVDHSGKILLVRSGVRVPKRALTKLRAMTPWIRFLSSDLSRQLSGTAQYQLRLKFASVQQSMAAIRELNSRAHAFVKSVEELGARPPVPRGCELDVAIAFAAGLNPSFKKPAKKR